MTHNIPKDQIVCFKTRQEWRAWLDEHFNTESQVWFTFPRKGSKESGVSYNDAVEEALCFGWIDSQAKTVGADRLQRFTPRRPGTPYSQTNKERLRWLSDQGLIHESMKAKVDSVLAEPFIWPEDILDTIRSEPQAWLHFQTFPEPYKRIRIAFIEGARERPTEFARRLNNFMEKTRAGKMISGYGGIDKYYNC